MQSETPLYSVYMMLTSEVTTPANSVLLPWTWSNGYPNRVTPGEAGFERMI